MQDTERQTCQEDCTEQCYPTQTDTLIPLYYCIFLLAHMPHPVCDTVAGEALDAESHSPDSHG